MKTGKYRPQGGIRDISSMEELQYHKMRLDLASNFLEEKLEGNIKEVKYRLSPKHLFRTVLTSVFSLIGNRRRKKHDPDQSDDHQHEEGNDSNVLLDGMIDLIKSMFRVG